VSGDLPTRREHLAVPPAVSRPPDKAIDDRTSSPFSPDNEVPIVADPANPNPLLAGSNDYQLTLTGSVILARVPTGFFTCFDGGRSWVDGQIPIGNGAARGSGDPSPAFDTRFHTAHMAQLSAAQGRFGPFAGHINVSVSTSRDGGVTWGQPVKVDIGHASTSPSANAVFLERTGCGRTTPGRPRTPALRQLRPDRHQ
jgi:hypothetical protein